jgi:hypothetical protein
MSFCRVSAAAFVVLTGYLLARANVPQQENTSDRLAQLRRDLAVIRVLVDKGVELSGEDEPLQRARTCKDLVSLFAQQTKQALARKDFSEASDMGRHVEHLLAQGVADNLARARWKAKGDALLVREIEGIDADLQRLTAALVEEMGSPAAQDAPEMRAAVKGLTQAQKCVNEAVTRKLPDSTWEQKKPRE